ncbi:MAG TPA: hypothetical protein VHO24_03880 [Opitutaceae bacterium]|nr:hypothetical protein [Opitutaceae bacterium]
MNLVWHIVLKDARRLWAPLVLWVILVTGHNYLEWVLAHLATDDAARLERAKFFTLLFFSIHVLSGYVLTAMLVMEDPPTGTSTFWLTRPISGARMLGAKLAGCLVFFIALPLLVSLPWEIAGAADAGALRAAIRHSLLWQGWVVTLAMIVAAFTGSLGKFIAWTLGLIPVVGVLLSLWQVTPGKFSRVAATPAFAIVLIGVGVAVVVQYSMRRGARAMAVLGGSAVCAAAAVFIDLW